ncbi:unnamed protein product [Callosobruchus maculatus]|uniref:Uncharacterized protein n=1 Tax=Callosobruchus maculatus TaxID=64391 RepID=A0A653C7A5_CALMS|nr:unnamed protein product [Callosobruchus maculatus]
MICLIMSVSVHNMPISILCWKLERLPTADLLTAITCDINSEKCMLEDDCSGCFDITDILPVNLVTDIAVVWKKWEKSESQYIPVSRQGTLNDLIQEIKKQTPIFKGHVFVKRQQSLHFENKKKNSTALEVVLQVDFAENFSILCQDEIQSAHWSHPQVTIFTGCAWSDAGNAKHSYIIMSNELNHDKYAVWAFMRKIIDDLKQKYPEMKKVSVFSDGCATQFKNRYTLLNLCYSKSDWGVEVDWNFFASSHGKGAVDGIGATAKRQLWSAIMTRRADIVQSYDCYAYLKSKDLSGVNLYFLTSGDIDQHKEALQKRWSEFPAIPLIQKHHKFQAINSNMLLYSETSCNTSNKRLVFGAKLKYADIYSSDESGDSLPPLLSKRDDRPLPGTPGPSVTHENKENTKIQHGAFILVSIRSETRNHKVAYYRYLAICQEPPEEDNEVKVMYMKNISKGNEAKQFVTTPNDVSYVAMSEIIEVLPEPTVNTIGNRIYYEFNENVDVFEAG